MFRALRIFYDRRFFAAVIYVALALLLSILLEPRPRFQLSDEERRSSITFTPDGRWFITAVHQATTKNDESITTSSVRLRDLATGDALRELGTIGGATPKISVSPDSTFVAASNDEEVIVWQTVDGKVRHQRKIPGPVDVMRFEPLILAVCQQRDPESQQREIVHLNEDRKNIPIAPATLNDGVSVILSQDGSKCAIWGYQEEQTVVSVWSLTDGRLICQRATGPKTAVAALCFAADGNSVFWIKNGKGGTAPSIVDSQLFRMFLDDSGRDMGYAFPPVTYRGVSYPQWFESVRTYCTMTPDNKYFIINGWHAAFTFDVESMTPTDSVMGGFLAPDGKYFAMRRNVSPTWPNTWQLVIRDLSWGSETAPRTLKQDGEESAEMTQWTPDSRYAVLKYQSNNGMFRWLKTFLKKLSINLNLNGMTTHEIQLVNPRSGRVDSSIKCEDPKSLHFAPDGLSCILDGYVYDVPFRKPWWAILGLPAVLALVVWRPYGKEKNRTTKNTNDTKEGQRA